MASAYVTEFGVADARPGATPTGGLLDRTGKPLGAPATVTDTGLFDAYGRPFRPTPAQVAGRVSSPVLLDQSPMFPQAPDPALAGMCDAYPAESPAWVEARPGCELGRALADVDPSSLDDAAVVDIVQAHSRMTAHHEARVAEALENLTARPVFDQCTSPAEVTHVHQPVRAAADEVSLAMTWTPGFADAKLSLAVELVQHLPATLAALRAGLIDAYKAKIIVDETRSLADDTEVRHAVESAALNVASDKTGPQLRAYVKRKVTAADPDSAEKRRTAARRSRNVSRPCPDSDGMAHMTVFGPLDDSGASQQTLQVASRSSRSPRDGEARQHSSAVGLSPCLTSRSSPLGRHDVIVAVVTCTGTASA